MQRQDFRRNKGFTPEQLAQNAAFDSACTAPHSRPMGPVDYKAATDIHSHLAYQKDIYIDPNKQQFDSQLYTEPLFTKPANFWGISGGRSYSAGGKEFSPVSQIWRNDGSLKMPERLIMHQPKVPLQFH